MRESEIDSVGSGTLSGRDVSAPASAAERRRNAKWWPMPDFSYLVLWWAAVIGYYVVIQSIAGRGHQELIDPELIADGWYVILASGLIGAFYAKRARPLWFLLSIVLALAMLVAMLLVLASLNNLMNP